MPVCAGAVGRDAVSNVAEVGMLERSVRERCV